MRQTPHPPIQNRTANAGRSRRYARAGGKGSEQIPLRSYDADFLVGDFDALGERTEMVATVTTALDPHTLPCRPGELAHHLRRDCLLAGAFEDGLSALGICLRLIARCLEAGDTVSQRRVAQIGHARLDGVIEPLQPKVGLGGALAQFSDVFAATFRALLPAVEHGGQHFLKPLGLQQPVLDMAGHKVVQLLHRDRAAFAARLALPCLDRAGVVAIAPALARAERHSPAAVGAEADAGKEGGAADHTGRRDLGVS